MKEAVAKRIITGRPYGGVAFSWHNSLNKYIQVLQGDNSGHCLAIQMQSSTKSFVMLTFTSRVSNPALNTEQKLVFLSFIYGKYSKHCGYDDIILIGNAYFSIEDGDAGFQLLKSFIQTFNMFACDDLITCSDKCTYVNTALGHV